MTIDVGDAQPIAQRPYRVPDKMKTQVEEQIRNLLEEGIIEESTSYWASPVVPVLKPNGSIRVCIDYRRLNAVTNKLEYYMPMLEDVLEKVGPCKIVSKLDMSQSFHQIEVDRPRIKRLHHVCDTVCSLQVSKNAFWSKKRCFSALLNCCVSAING